MHRIHNLLDMLRPAGVPLLAAILLLAVFAVEGVLANHQVTLEGAIAEYKAANYDRAIELLSIIVQDDTADLEHRREALQYISRCYIAKRLNEQAKGAILELLSLEPPLVEFDPDRESPPFMKVYYEARKDNSDGSYQVEHPDPGIKTLAVIDFRNNSITDRETYDPLEKGFPDIVINRLNGATELRVIERERLQWILDELEIQNRYDMEGAVRAGKQLGVHAVLMGSFIINKKEIWISARLVKVETSEVLLTEEVKGRADKFFDLTAELSEKVAQAIDIKVDLAAADEPKKDSNSLEATLAYSQGLQLLEQSDYDGAYEKFAAALEFDPAYEKARIKAASIEPLLDTYAAR